MGLMCDNIFNKKTAKIRQCLIKWKTLNNKYKMQQKRTKKSRNLQGELNIDGILLFDG